MTGVRPAARRRRLLCAGLMFAAGSLAIAADHRADSLLGAITSPQPSYAAEPEPTELLQLARKPELHFSALQLKDLQGRTISPAAFKSKPVVVVVWSIYCRSCVPTMQELETLRDELDADGIGLMTVHLFEPNTATIDRRLDELNIELPVYLGTKETRDQFAIRLLPTSLLFDAGHKLVGRIDGIDTIAELRRAIEAQRLVGLRS